MKQFLIILLINFPFVCFAIDKPSMITMWLDLGFLVMVIISLKVANITLKRKAIIFIAYILAGIATKTIWFPVLIWVVLFILFKDNSDDAF